MKKEKSSTNQRMELDQPRLAAMKRVLKRMLFALAVLGIAGTSSGCLVVRDDEGHHHWRWHHEAPPPPP